MHTTSTLQEWLPANPQLAAYFTDNLERLSGHRQLPEGGTDRTIDPASPDLTKIDQQIALKEEPESKHDRDTTSSEVEVSRAGWVWNGCTARGSLLATGPAHGGDLT
jgi:hypothetical protein